MPIRRFAVPLALISLLAVAAPAQTPNAKDNSPELANLAPSHGIALWWHQFLANQLGSLLVAEDVPEGAEVFRKAREHFRKEFNLQPAERLRLAELLRTPFGRGNKTAEEAAKNPQPDEEAVKVKEAQILAGLPAILTDQQLRRFTELHCQIEGMRILRLSKYASTIGLRNDQKSKIEKLASDYQAKSYDHHRDIFSSRSPQQAAPSVRKLNLLSKELDAQILDVLTAEQRSKWTAMVGKLFEWRPVLNVLAYEPLPDP